METVFIVIVSNAPWAIALWYQHKYFVSKINMMKMGRRLRRVAPRYRQEAFFGDDAENQAVEEAKRILGNQD